MDPDPAAVVTDLQDAKFFPAYYFLNVHQRFPYYFFDDRRILIRSRISDYRIPIQIQDAQKHTDPQH